MFCQGTLHNTPFTWVDDCGWGYLVSNMHNGRPAANNSSYFTYFYKNGRTQHVDSLDIKANVSGWQYYSGQIDKERRLNGEGKHWKDDGSIYIGR